MKATLTIAAAVLAFSAATAHAEIQSGEEFHRLCGGAVGAGFLNHDACHGQVTWEVGVLQARHQVCLPYSIPDRTLVMAVQAFMRERPDQLRFPAYRVIAEALTRDYPCRRW